MPDDRVPQCPFCRVAMQPGVILDRVAGTNVRPIWIPEPAEESWFGGLREPSGPEMTVATYRCSGCGFLASYAALHPSRADDSAS